ncbi:MAG: hypothetical protein IKC26_02120 [Clostridia bacterium]|nr:hypothetical protein [Clostridia bacterium]
MSFLLLYADLFLAVAILIGVMLMSVGSTKHNFGLELSGIVITVICCLWAYCLFGG